MDPNEKVKRTVSGVEVEKTLDEWLRDAEKAGGADARFREAADVRRQAEQLQAQAGEGVRLQSMMAKARTGDVEALKYVALNVFGYTEQEYEELQALASATDTAGATPPPVQNPQQQTGGPQVDPGIAKLQEAVNTLQAQIGSLTGFMHRSTAGDLRGGLNSALDNDPTVRYTLSRAKTPEQKQKLLADLRDQAEGVLRRRVDALDKNATFDSQETIAASIKDVASRLSLLGFDPEQARQAAVKDTITALGSSGAILPASFQSLDKLPEPVSVSDPKYAENLMVRLAANRKIEDAGL